MAPSSKVQPLPFCIVNLTTTNLTMNPDQGIQFHIRHNVRIVLLNELINIRMHGVLEFLSILAYIRENELAMQRYIPEKAVYKFFDRRNCTPDLTEMFENIDRSRLKLTSSAI
ncbi:uncharacterized protein LOC117212528 [Bombus bifarius]|uniref:Uncharacterized protein LOC117212528 n=1 Tax=Bombus bifarius TaxID=103933 RepID=A0A6P8MXQ9_9HYME|nr:uncharacterized protein LOC117212528 [Bombus bifarius]